MIRNACVKRTASLSSLRWFGTTNFVCSSNVSNSRIRPLTRTILSDSLQTQNHSRPRQRYLSASAPSSVSSKRPRRKTPKRQQRQRLDNEEQPIPIWPAVASVLIVPIMFAAWGATDWIFGNRTKGHNEGLRQKFLEEQRRGQNNNRDNEGSDDDWLLSLESKPTLFHCVIRQNTGLTHCLSGVQLGDVVEVLEEGVGPERSYNLCRLPAKPAQPGQPPSLSRDTYGWFPIRWLQKLEHYEFTVREQRINMSRDNPE